MHIITFVSVVIAVVAIFLYSFVFIVGSCPSRWRSYEWCHFPLVPINCEARTMSMRVVAHPMIITVSSPNQIIGAIKIELDTVDLITLEGNRSEASSIFIIGIGVLGIVSFDGIMPMTKG